MSDPTSTTTAFDRARRYQELSRATLAATESDATLTADMSPYEGQYGTLNLYQQSEELADVAGFYRACGLTAPVTERVDHLAVELEFMSFLAQKEAYALHESQLDRAEDMRELQKKFLTEHLARWVPSFAARFERREPKLAAELREWVMSDLRALGGEMAQVRFVDLRAAGEIEESFQCGGGTCDIA